MYAWIDLVDLIGLIAMRRCWESCWYFFRKAAGIFCRKTAGIFSGKLLVFFQESCWYFFRKAADIFSGKLLVFFHH
jgi:hypothetical protein